MGAKERNEAAREIATENPGRVADHAMGSEWLRAALNAWPLPDLGGEMWPGPVRTMTPRSASRFVSLFQPSRRDK